MLLAFGGVSKPTFLYDNIKLYCLSTTILKYKVWNVNAGAYFTAKGYNARCVLAWLSDCMSLVLTKSFPPQRTIGAWLQTEVALNNCTWPQHEMLEPTGVAMFLS